MKQTVIFLFTIIMLFLPCWVVAQKEVAHGVVKDSAGEPIPLAVVLTVNPQDSSIVAHTVSNSAGVFRIKENWLVNSGYKPTKWASLRLRGK